MFSKHCLRSNFIDSCNNLMNIYNKMHEHYNKTLIVCTSLVRKRETKKLIQKLACSNQFFSFRMLLLFILTTQSLSFHRIPESEIFRAKELVFECKHKLSIILLLHVER